MIVAIHQPNYLPWLGYFHKIALADFFVFLDDAQFSKNSYTNRTRILAEKGPRWLTIPVSFRFADPINRVRAAQSDWAARHLDTLRGAYGNAPAFGAIWPRLREMVGTAAGGDVAAVNRRLVELIAGELGLACRFEASSALGVAGRSDDRLVELTAAIDRGATYLSGEGGAKYQDPAKFAAAGLGFRYAGFEHPVYDQGRQPFEPGLSIVDALFHQGWAGTAELILAAGTGS